MYKTIIGSAAALLLLGGSALAQTTTSSPSTGAQTNLEGAGNTNTGTGGVNGRTRQNVITGTPGVTENNAANGTPMTGTASAPQPGTIVAPNGTVGSTAVNPSGSGTGTGSVSAADPAAGNNSFGGVQGRTAPDIRTGQDAATEGKVKAGIITPNK